MNLARPLLLLLLTLLESSNDLAGPVADWLTLGAAEGVAFFCITKVGRKIELIFELKLQLANSIF
jgi:hypothetical protein